MYLALATKCRDTCCTQLLPPHLGGHSMAIPSLQASGSTATTSRDTAAFLDTAPSWAELERTVQQQQKQLGWSPPDPVTVSPGSCVAGLQALHLGLWRCGLGTEALATDRHAVAAGSSKCIIAEAHIWTARGAKDQAVQVQAACVWCSAASAAQKRVFAVMPYRLLTALQWRADARLADTSHTMPAACCRDSAAWCPYCESCSVCGLPCCLGPALCLPFQSCLFMMLVVAVAQSDLSRLCSCLPGCRSQGIPAAGGEADPLHNRKNQHALLW